MTFYKTSKSITNLRRKDVTITKPYIIGSTSIYELGMTVHTCSLAPGKMRQEGSKLKTNLGYTRRFCLKTKFPGVRLFSNTVVGCISK